MYAVESVSTKKMKHQSNLYVCWQPYIEFCHDCWNSGHSLTSFCFCIFTTVEMWFAFCNTGAHALKSIITIFCLLELITIATELFQLMEEL